MPRAMLVTLRLCAGFAASLALYGCGLESVDQNDGSTRQAGAPRLTDILDGTSNTIQTGETSAPRPAPGGVVIGDGSVRQVGGGASTTPGPESPAGGTTPGAGQAPVAGGAPATPSASDAQAIAALTEALKNTRSEFGRASGNSDNNAFVTGTNELFLCASGRFDLRETTIFSSQFGSTFTSEDDTVGTWAIVMLAPNTPAIELRVEDSTNRNSPAVRQIAITVDAQGNAFFNGESATIEPTQACGG
ncbi:MAG: hypothetical protein U1D55_02175 [Phycisphaerae bacterium]